MAVAFVLALASAMTGVVDVVQVQPIDASVCALDCSSPAVRAGSVSPFERPALPERPAASPPSLQSARIAPPTMVTIASLDVQAPIDAVGLLAGGGLAVPDDAARIGWFAPVGFELAPGDPGTAVLAGHRDSRRTGPGAFHGLADIGPGARIVVQHADGRVSDWEVERSVLAPRDALPVDELFTRSGPPRLALVTCGGAFDAARRRYSHNVIVYAMLVGVSG